MKARKKAEAERRLVELDKFLTDLSEHAEVAVSSPHPTHWQIEVDGNRTDFWPTTGSWFDYPTRQRGKDFSKMAEVIMSRVDSRPFVLSGPDDLPPWAEG